MTREIKFRAFHPDWDEMIYSDKVDCFEKRDYYPFIFTVGFSHYPKDYRWILMQYTGLKDKNRKEIYEGDILRHENSKSIGVMEWDNSGSWVKFYPLTSFEVIGNIYENQELLN